MVIFVQKRRSLFFQKNNLVDFVHKARLLNSQFVDFLSTISEWGIYVTGVFMESDGIYEFRWPLQFFLQRRYAVVNFFTTGRCWFYPCQVYATCLGIGDRIRISNGSVVKKLVLFQKVSWIFPSPSRFFIFSI